jgi:hypothetical protein
MGWRDIHITEELFSVPADCQNVVMLVPFSIFGLFFISEDVGKQSGRWQVAGGSGRKPQF